LANEDSPGKKSNLATVVSFCNNVCGQCDHIVRNFDFWGKNVPKLN
jgi:hypothetical protein